MKAIGRRNHDSIKTQIQQFLEGRELNCVARQLLRFTNYAPLHIVNRSDASLRLSAMDKVQLQFREPGGPRTVDAFLDLSQSDKAWWNGLPQDLRSALAYPDQAPIRKNEEENVFAFIPIASASTLPTEILFTVNNYSSTPVSLRELAKAAL